MKLNHCSTHYFRVTWYQDVIVLVIQYEITTTTNCIVGQVVQY